MGRSPGPIGFALVLIGVASASPSLRGQYLPIRELDSNGLIGGREIPAEVVDGIATGVGTNGNMDLAVLWDDSGSTTLPPVTGFAEAAAEGLASPTLACGWSWDPATFALVATRWNGGVAEDLNAFVTGGAPLLLFRANDVEERGRIVGVGYDAATGLAHPFLFDQGNVTDLGSLNGGAQNARVRRLNRRLQAAGASETAGATTTHACLFDGGAAIDLHDSSVMTVDYSEANDIARDGSIVGSWGISINAGAFLWDGQKIVDLTSLIPPGRSVAIGTNDFGDVVGWYDPTCSRTTICPLAFLLRDGQFFDLNSLIDPALGWGLLHATDIDNEGRIVGFGSFGGSSFHAFLIDPGCLGTFTSYGTGCAGTAGIEPVLRGTGCPAPDRDFALEVVDGVAGAFGLLFIGSGNGSAPVKPGCDLQVLPLVAPVAPLLLDA